MSRRAAGRWVPETTTLAAATLCWCTGCSGPPGAGRTLGEDLGTFHVSASELDNTCGDGAFGSSERFEFDVDLSRDATELFWDGRVGGRVGAARDFVFSASVRVDVPMPQNRSSPCVLTRRDSVSGVLLEDASGSVARFEGRMVYQFEADAGCDDLDLPRLGLPSLPCALEYALRAERTRSPEP